VNGTELLYRGLVRLPTELKSRPSQDAEDFLRRKNYRKTGKPENGLSVFRKTKFANLQAFWDRLSMTNPVGVAECKTQQIESKGLKLKIGGANAEHISIRCPDCNMKDAPEICKPAGAEDHWDCPFFDVDTFDLAQLFVVVDEPKVRTLTSKKK
jgi:hypothetical protein